MILMKVNPNRCLIFAKGLNGKEITENIIRLLKLQGVELEKSFGIKITEKKMA